MKSLLAHVVVFFYVYIISFKFIPIGTRAFLGVLGLTWFAAQVFQNGFKLNINKHFAKFLIILFFIGLSSIISIGYNQTTDTEFLKYVISITFLIFSSYFVIMTLYRLKYNLNFEAISAIIINVVFIQSILAVLMFALPGLQDFLIATQRFSDLAEDQMNVYKAYRVIGFGTMFFDAGIISGYALILIGVMIRLYGYASNQILILLLKFLVIMVVGMAMARTTMTGALIATIIIFMPSNAESNNSLMKNRYLFLLHMTLIPTFLISVVLILHPEIAQNFESVFYFAFEIFINLAETGSLKTESSDVLKTLFIFPDNIKTYIIGDGYFSDPSGNGYYMHTDVGYLRLVYYFGLVGLSAFFIMQYYAISRAFKEMGVRHAVSLFFFAYLLILNLKGFADILSFTILYWMHLLTTEKPTA